MHLPCAPRTPLRRSIGTATATALLLGGVALAGTTSPAAASQARSGWVGSWATAAATTSGVGATGFEDVTLRQVVHLSVGGSQARVRLTNAFGTVPLVVNATTVALRGPGGGASVSGVPIPVTFSGAGDVTLAPGTERVSDPIGLTVADDSDLVISTYLPTATGPATGRGSAWATSYVATGDASRTPGTGGRYAPLGTSWYFLDGVDVSTRSSGAVVLFGDSITEGCCSASSVDTNTRYGDFLADRLLQGPDQQQMGVLNAGISGNQLLANGAGVSALARFERDVLGQTGARSVILLEGINDIGISRGAITPEQVIAVYRQFIVRSHDAGLKIFGGTLTPYVGASYSTPEGEQDRQAVNRWIRTSGEFDGVVDFDKAIRDPRDPSRMLSVYDPGDHLHPNAAGYAAMANAVKVAALR